MAVEDGIATLSGHLQNYVEKYAIERAVKRVAGVRAIALDPEVELARSTTDIAAERALGWTALVPIDAIRVMVVNGWVTLSGEVDWDYQRHAA